VAEPAVIVAKDGPVLTVALNRPEKRNAINCESMCRLYDAWHQLDQDDELRVAILTGRGSTFCAGMDLSEIGKMSAGKPENEWMKRAMTEPALIYGAWLKTYRPTKPVILAAEGFARAGGTEILQGTDIRVAAEGATFGVWEAKRGLFPLGGSACRLPRQIPYTWAMEILLACPAVSARDALRMGLIGRVVPDGQALDTAREVAEQVAANAPLSTQAILRAWRETEHMSDFEAMQHQDPIGWAVFASEDAQEGPRALAEKRSPAFRGK
jgi:enoyl-CoA hydratase